MTDERYAHRIDGTDMAAVDTRTKILALLIHRAVEATICPSEVAKALAARDWRGAMPAVHKIVDQLNDEGLVRLSWKGKPLPNRVGPYRIGRGPRF